MFEEKEAKQPHDLFVKKFFSIPRRAIELFKLSLPQDLLEILDIEKLEVMQSVHEKTGKRTEKAIHNDLLFKIPLKSGEADAHLLFEHKSYQEKKIFEQIQENIEAIRNSVLLSFPMFCTGGRPSGPMRRVYQRVGGRKRNGEYWRHS